MTIQYCVSCNVIVEHDIPRHGGYLCHHCQLQKAFDLLELVYQEERVEGGMWPRVVEQVWGNWCEEDKILEVDLTQESVIAVALWLHLGPGSGPPTFAMV